MRQCDNATNSGLLRKLPMTAATQHQQGFQTFVIITMAQPAATAATNSGLLRKLAMTAATQHQQGFQTFVIITMAQPEATAATNFGLLRKLAMTAATQQWQGLQTFSAICDVRQCDTQQSSNLQIFKSSNFQNPCLIPRTLQIKFS
jgi:crotonobetainyl-CoA:carnitine CoA-transferase CaiB-like acyl-CoA transferase